jgi:hypothetical protein
VKLLAPIQADFQSNKEWQEIEKKAYPPPAPVDKKKKEKKKGTGHPGLGAAAAGAAGVAAVAAGVAATSQSETARDRANLESITAASKATVVQDHIRRASAAGFLWLNPGTAIQTGPGRGPPSDRTAPMFATTDASDDSDADGLQQPNGGTIIGAAQQAAQKAMNALGLGKS